MQNHCARTTFRLVKLCRALHLNTCDIDGAFASVGVLRLLGRAACWAQQQELQALAHLHGRLSKRHNFCCSTARRSNPIGTEPRAAARCSVLKPFVAPTSK